MAGKPWLKLWTDWIHDPKILNLSIGEKGAWCLLLSLAQECEADGYLVLGNGNPMSLDDIARCLHITAKKELAILQSMIKKMESLGSLAWNSKALVVVNFATRQSLVTSDTKEAVRDRVRRFRERQVVTETALPPLTTAEALAKEIRATLMALPKAIDSLIEHEMIKDTLAKLAQARGLVPKSEVIIDTGRIDLLWEESSGKAVAAFEIDVYKPKKKSLTKLKSLDCPYAFVILRTNPQPLQWEDGILWIGLKGKESNKEKETIKDIDTEGEGEGESNGVTPVTLTDSPDSNVTDKPLKAVHGMAKNVLLTEKELKNLHEKYGVTGTEERIDALSLYKGSKGKKYASDYLTILNWERMHEKEGKGGINGAHKGHPGPITDEQYEKGIGGALY